MLRRILLPPFLVAAVGLNVGAAAAQQEEAAPPREPGRLLVRVLDANTSSPVGQVEIRLPTAEERTAITDAEGRARFGSLAPAVHEMELRHITYGTRSQLVNVPEGRTVELEVELVPRAIRVEPLTVDVTIRPRGLEREGYFDRRRLGFGTYFDPAEVDGMSLAGMLREVPGLRLAPMRGSAFRHRPYFTRGARTCPPTLVVDGMYVRLRGMAIEDMVDRHNVLAMEVYRPGNTPGQFQYTFHRDCGAVVIWTRARTR